MNRTLRLAAACVPLIIALGVAPEAHAQTQSVKDKAGDTKPSYVPGSDARKAWASYGKGRLTVRVKVPKLASKKAMVQVYVDQAGKSTYPEIQYLGIKKKKHGTRTGFYTYNEYVGEVHKRKCNVKGSWSAKKGIVKLSAPKKCIKWSRVKVHVVTGAFAEGSSDYGYDHLKRMVVRYN